MAIPTIINNIIALFGDSMNSLIPYNESIIGDTLVNILENDIAPLTNLLIRYITPEMIRDKIKISIIVIIIAVMNII